MCAHTHSPSLNKRTSTNYLLGLNFFNTELYCFGIAMWTGITLTFTGVTTVATVGDSSPEMARWLVHMYLVPTQGQVTVHIGIIISYEGLWIAIKETSHHFSNVVISRIQLFFLLHNHQIGGDCTEYVNQHLTKVVSCAFSYSVTLRMSGVLTMTILLVDEFTPEWIMEKAYRVSKVWVNQLSSGYMWG